MSRYLTILAFAGACALQGQTANPLIAEAKQAYTGIKNNLLKMADKMPAEQYDFKASPDVRTFGQLVAHVADAQTRTCSTIKGQPKPGDAASKTAKADLVAALQASFAECDGAFESLTDASAMEMMKTPRGERSKLGALIGNTTHDNEEYGYMAVYMRLKGLVPPSSERR
ncbi:MAG: DinB family protein [Acidobacteria bacterium]|nr:DinB family protein [Acidobacteriota bacterium]